MNDPTADWEFLLRDPGPAPPPRPPRRARMLAAARTVRAARLLRRRGWPDAQQYLRSLRPTSQVRWEPTEAVRIARREVLPCLTWLRLADPEALCLPRSYALVTYLTTLGLPAEVVVARQRSSIGGRFAFHAWAELYDEVLGDIPGLRTGFAVLQCIGSEQVRRAEVGSPGNPGNSGEPGNLGNPGEPGNLGNPGEPGDPGSTA